MNENNIAKKDIQDIGYKTLFTGDLYLMFVHKKSHSISSAVYLITDFFNDTEPLKNRMRNLALDLSTLSLSLSTELSPNRKSILDGIIRTALSLTSLSEVAMYSGVESEMNHTILSTELRTFISAIEDREVPSRLGRHFVLDQSFFSEPQNLNLQGQQTPLEFNTGNNIGDNNSVSNKKEHIQNASTIQAGQVNTSRAVGSGAMTLNTVKARPSHQPADQSIKTNKSHSDIQDKKKSERRSIIINTIRQKGELSIKDITTVVRDCSEKTIQRELLDMVAQGVLKKEGERRWSRYSVI